MAAPQAASVPERVERRAPHALTRPRTRLTGELIDEMAGLAATGTPLADIAAYVNVPIYTLNEWRRRGERAADYPRSQLSQLDRLCVTFMSRMRQGAGQAAVRTHLAIAKAAGITREENRVVDRRTTVTVDPETGLETTTSVTIDRQIPADWRAAAHIGRYRFPDTMSDERPAEEPETPTGTAINPGQLLERLFQIRDERAAAGAVIDTTSIELPPAETNGHQR